MGARGTSVEAYPVAQAHLGLGERDQAMRLLETARADCDVKSDVLDRSAGWNLAVELVPGARFLTSLARTRVEPPGATTTSQPRVRPPVSES